MNVSDFDYDLPADLIAQHPAARREASRLLSMDRQTGHCHLHSFADFPSFLRPGDCLVLNDTKVIPGRLFAHRQPTQGRVELLLIEPADGEHEWHCLVKPGRRLHPGDPIRIAGAAEDGDAIIAGRNHDGSFRVRFMSPDVHRLLERYGAIPLPPYIQREADKEDRERYQTVYAEQPGAVAAPTAGLHFTRPMLDDIAKSGIALARVTLHVGPGTFRPVKSETIEGHDMHEERYLLTPANAEIINAARAQGGRVIAIGTTSVRVLETCWEPAAKTVMPATGRTRIFLHPPRRPQAVDGLLTNFHLPRSTLLMLVSTFSSVEQVLAAYRLAVQERFRFFSYGDCMLLL